ncbi:hypothetical protein Q8X48_02620 [Pseudomonas sp. QLc11A]|uniref:Uncharacterized protein n=1 Tax=Pseudomonas azerbaijanorientalis TaxID=2842350 RepID=A0ABW8W1K5_9PSED
MGVAEKAGSSRLSLVNQWQLPLRFNALFTPSVTSVKAKAAYLATPQKSPSDAQNPPNAYALPLTSVASGSAESTASEKTTFE